MPDCLRRSCRNRQTDAPDARRTTGIRPRTEARKPPRREVSVPTAEDAPAGSPVPHGPPMPPHARPAPPEQSVSSFRAVRGGKRTARHEDGLFGTVQAGGGNLKRETQNRTKTEEKPEADRAKCGKRRNENGPGSRKRQTERRRKNKNREKNPPGKECAWKAAEGRPASERGKTREAEKRAGKRKERKGGTTVRKKSDGPRHATADTFNEKPAAEILLPPAPWRTRSEIRAVSASGGRHPICRRPDRRDAPIGYARFACGPSRLKTAQERTRNSFFKPGAEPNAGSVSARGGKRTRKKQPFH